MITINNSDQVIVKHNNKEYNIKNKNQYKELIIYLTDPNEKIDASIFDIDEKLTDERLKSICLKYQEFFHSYLSLKEQAIKEAKESLKETIETE